MKTMVKSRQSNAISKAAAEGVSDLCSKHGISRLELFGSACTSHFDPARSDFDFLIEFASNARFGPWFVGFFEFKDALERALGRPVDLIMPSALKDPFFRLKSRGSIRKLKCLRCLNEVRRACELIQLVALNKSPTDFEADWILRSAVERKFEVVSQALKRLSEIDLGVAARVPDYQAVIRFRHWVADLDCAYVWKVIQEDVPALRRSVLELIDETNP